MLVVPSTPAAGAPVEVVPAVIDGNVRRDGAAMPVAVRAAALPTQLRHPWRSVARGLWQNFIGLCVLLPVLVEVADVDAGDWRKAGSPMQLVLAARPADEE